MRFDLARRLSSCDGLGSTTAMGPSFLAIQPLRSAVPMRPAPMRTIVVRCDLRLSGTLEHGGRDGFLRGLAAPQHELERRVIVFARFDGEIEQRLALGGAR